MWRKSFEYLKTHLSPDTVEQYGPKDTEQDVTSGEGEVEVANGNQDGSGEGEVANSDQDVSEVADGNQGEGEVEMSEVTNGGNQEAGGEVSA